MINPGRISAFGGVAPPQNKVSPDKCPVLSMTPGQNSAKGGTAAGESGNQIKIYFLSGEGSSSRFFRTGAEPRREHGSPHKTLNPI